MNNRIREVARDVGIKMIHDETLALGYLDTAQKRFAELLINECAEVCRLKYAYSDATSRETALAFANDINQRID